MAKFNFKKALESSLPAFAGGAATEMVTDAVSTNFPDYADKAIYAPAFLGFFLSQNKNNKISGAGLGMLGAAAGPIMKEVAPDMFSINGARIGRRRGKGALTPAQQMTALKQIQSKMKVAGPNYTSDALANAYGGASSDY